MRDALRDGLSTVAEFVPKLALFLVILTGLGTLPAMASTSILLGASWPKISQHRWFKATAGITLVVFGVWMIIVAQQPHDHAAHAEHGTMHEHH